MFIELTLLNGNKVLVNISRTLLLHGEGQGTCLGVDDRNIFIKESYEDVKKILGVK